MQNKLPDPWLLDTEKLIERLAKCRQLVMHIPISSLEQTQLGIRYALTEILNLEDHLRYCLQYHREAQARFAKLAQGKPVKETRTNAKVKLVSFSA
jgi:hypothetical protein